MYRSNKFSFSVLRYFRSLSIGMCVLFIVMISAASVTATTFVVTNVNDTGAGSLRQAIIDSNAAGGVGGNANVINFNIAGGIVRTVNLITPLPNIVYDLTINGTTMPGYAGAPLFELNGSNISGVANGLTNRSGRLTVKALIINRFGGNGIESKCSPTAFCDSNFNDVDLNVTGCYIGIDKNGVLLSPNQGNGIYYQPQRAFGATAIGGPLPSERNIISGNVKNGILIRKPDTYNGNVFFINNYIGPNAAGTSGIGNGQSGIAVEDSPSSTTGLSVYVGNEIGSFGTPQTPTVFDRNVISSNSVNGIFSTASATTFQVQGNYIGTNASGTVDLGNVGAGIKVSGMTTAGPQNLIVGGPLAVEANVISGNSTYGVETSNASSYIQGNKIGTVANGTSALGNSLDGVRISGASSYVGGSNAGEGNLISGNANGVTIESTGDLTRVEGNKIGSNLAGTGAIPNSLSGIVVKASGIGIGFSNNAPSVNLIVGNGGSGVAISGTADGVTVYNNLIGVTAGGAALGNAGNGVLVQGCATNIRVGDDVTIPVAANTIAFNGADGVSISNICLGLPPASPPPTTVTVRRNSIYSNSSLGIDLGPNGPTLNDVGDTDTGPNGLQNFPVLVKASPAQIYGTFNSLPNQSYKMDIFQAPTCSSSGYGEGRNLLGTVNLGTDASGNAVYNLTGFVISVGQIITATVTDASGNTSEFSQCLTVTNNPGNLAFNVASSSTAELSGVAAVTIDRIGGASGVITVDYSTSNGTATAGQDYTASSGTVTFLNGDVSKTIFIPITNDTTDEPAETFNVTLGNPGGGAFIGSPSTHVVTINDDDPPPTVSISDVSVLEGNQGTSTLTFNITQSAVSGFTTSVNYSTANGTATAGIDYIAGSGTVNFAPGEVLKTVAVTVNSDLVPEIDETLFVNLSAPVNLTISDGQGVGTILDDDNPGKISFAFATYSVSEGSPNATITLTRTNGTAGAAAVNYATSNGTATAGSDYTSVSGTAIFNDGQSSTSFSVPILPDAIGEANETVQLSIGSPLGGASMGLLTSAVLTIFDDDGGLPPNVSIGGQIVENSLPLAGVVVTLAGSQVATTQTNASGNYTFAGLPSAGNYLITPTLSGHSFGPQSLSYTNLAANITNANFVGSTGPAARNLHVVSNSTASGQSVTVSVDLTSQGNENSSGFSLGYDSTLVFNPQVSLGSDAAAATLVVNSASPGRLGIIAALPAGQVFPAGSRQLVKIAFNTVPTALFSTPLVFTDAPITRMTTDANASGLPVSYSDGLIGFSQGFEADVASRPAGDGFIAVDDFTQVGRFVAGLDIPDSPVSTNEFQRADSSPRGTKGDGVLAVDDFTQAGRYAAGLDLGQKAGGPTGPLGLAEIGTLNSALLINAPDAARDIHVVSASAAPGSQIIVSIEMEALGDENGIGFSVNYDTLKLSNPLVTAGSGAQGTFLIPNTGTAGKVGVIIAFAPGSTISAGTKQLVTIRFDIAGSAAAGPTPLTMADGPVIRRVSSANATPLTASFTDGDITILAPTAAGVTAGGRITNAAGEGLGSVSISLTGPQGDIRTILSNPFGYYEFDEVPAGESYVISVTSKTHIFDPSSRLITPNDAVEVIFVSVD